jgi:hypothetical protein
MRSTLRSRDIDDGYEFAQADRTLGQGVALGEDACHFRRVLSAPGTQRDDGLTLLLTPSIKRLIWP